MSRALAAVAAVFLLSVVCSPASANWFGKRGDKDDLFSLLLQQQQQQPTHADSSVVPLASSGAEEAMFAIENIVQAWRQHRSEKLARSTQG
uniref:Neuropeptide (NdWFamide) n=1 Tax=Aplysia kurodai TaxID=6501 RepID=K7ZNI8_APLKU|nr:neuropeptide (NdWFamide) precursor [Aplysia kurodai]